MLQRNYNQQVLVVFDVGKSHKKRIDKEYKKRILTKEQKELRKTLFEDYDLMISLLNYVVPVFYKEGYEGDELIYNIIYAYRYCFEKYPEFYIHTVDWDLLQLIDKKVKVVLIDSRRIVDEKNFKQVTKFEDTVDFLLYKILAGDASDNIEGILQDKVFIENCLKNGLEGKEKLFKEVIKQDKLRDFFRNVFLVILVPQGELIDYITAKLRTWRRDLRKFREEVLKRKLSGLVDYCVKF